MFKHFFVVLVLVCFLFFLYGIKNIFLEVEDNACRMTYMFAPPMFSRLELKANQHFPNYGLYYYYEGNFQRDMNNLQLNGAPVLFVPGNSGSYKQVRSLASVALQKAKNDGRKTHLDYFTVDYNEELSALHGAYLENQQRFLKHCIKRISNLYGNERQHEKKSIVIIGHSMGGKVVQSVLMDDNVRQMINSVIFISTPLDRPVFFSDPHMISFYQKTNEYYQREFTQISSTNHTNKLQDVLLLSIGGGNRDLLVLSSLTSSRYLDLHAMTSSIPHVWLSCDHLSVLWCLQLVLVINRFLFSILVKPTQRNHVYFNENKNIRLQAAQHFFVHSREHAKSRNFEKEITRAYTWEEDSRRVFGRKFLKTLKEPFHQLLPLLKHNNNNNDNYNQNYIREKLYVEVFNEDDNDWIYGCSAHQLESNTQKYVCEIGTPLAHFVENIPTRYDKYRSFALLDLHNIKKTYRNWTHILLRLLPNKDEPLRYNVDIFNPAERVIKFRAPRWYCIRPTELVNETLQRTIYYRMHITDLVEPFISFSVNINSIACKNPSSYYVTAKLTVPWARGFERFYHISPETQSQNILVNVPIAAPLGFNTSENPAILEIFMDPSCRFSISFNFEIAATMSRMVLEFYTWLPSHLTAVLLIVLKNQVLKLNKPMRTLRTIKPYLDFFQYTSLYIVTVARVFKGLLLRRDDPLESRFTIYTLYASLIIHCMAIVSCIIVGFIAWLALIIQGNFFLKIITRFSSTAMSASSTFMTIVSYLPITCGVLAVSIGLSTCAGIGIIICCAVYFTLISDAYKDYLQDLMLKMAASLIKKLKKCTLSEDASGTATEITPMAENTITENVSEQQTTPPTEDNRSSAEQPVQHDDDDERFEGLQNFSFHMTLFLLLCMHALLNVTGIMAWARNHSSGNHLLDPFLIPSIILMCVLSMLWQLKAPHYYATSYFGNIVVAIILYICASSAVIFCQDASYLLSYIITFVYIIILCNELLHRMWKMCTPLTPSSTASTVTND